MTLPFIDTSSPSGASRQSGVNLRTLLDEMVARNASDLHIVAGVRPQLRIDGDMTNAAYDVELVAKDTLQVAYSVLTEQQKKRFELDDELDFSFGIQNLARFRGNVFKQRGCVSMVIRQIPFAIKTFDQLGLPGAIAKMAEKPRGLVLVTGPTGSGKSTTLAAMIDKINRERKGHIITVEDPIEFIHKHQGCIVNQREIGSDTKSFANALKYALREDPDTILIGEMRDLETIQAALTIAETGHLAFATLHTNSAAEAINRIIDVFPAHQQSQVRAQLAFVLEGIITQTLLPKAQGKGRVMAAEILVVTPAIRALIRDDKIHQIYSTMQAGKKYGMQTLNDALYVLYMNREVTAEECLRVTSEPVEFQRMIGQADPAAEEAGKPAARPPVTRGPAPGSPARR
ncbi:MAG TPA: type IV pilus twitching motility protein PilT [Gemmatimonadaceae bacterium]|jgi:twitching motility protein PilT|nr:type IV pilus twitching motility protein PilT [Gemmatimonadaceae bacterium]